MRQSIRFRIGILYTVALIAILSVLGAVNYIGLRNILFRDIDASLSADAQEVALLIGMFEDFDRMDEMALDLPSGETRLMRYNAPVSHRVEMLRRWWERESRELGMRRRLVSVHDGNGNVLVDIATKSGESASSRMVQMPYSSARDAYATVLWRGQRIRVLNHPFLYAGKDCYIVRIGAALSPTQHVLDLFLSRYIAISCAIVVLMSFMGRLIAARVLLPVSGIVSMTREITHHDLSKRVPAEHADKEMHELVDSINSMLERLEIAFGQINEFSANAAHELKTPLAIMKGEMEVALMGKDRTPAEYRRTMSVCLEEVTRQTRIIEDLLYIARVDYRTDIFSFEKMDVAVFAAELCERCAPLADIEGMTLVCGRAEPAWAMIDAPSVRRMLTNLISNAIKYGKGGTNEIGVTVSATTDRISIDVRDHGCGIAPQHCAHIFEKFYRVRETKEADAKGCGLGLSIARAIARAHGGEITVRSALGSGSSFTVVLPRLSS